jgi:hypothetical protein
MLAFPSGRLRRFLPVPLEQGRSHGSLRLLQDGRGVHRILKNKTPVAESATGVLFFWSLAMTYSHMGKPHTTIGDASFHF